MAYIIVLWCCTCIGRHIIASIVVSCLSATLWLPTMGETDQPYLKPDRNSCQSEISWCKYTQFKMTVRRSLAQCHRIIGILSPAGIMERNLRLMASLPFMKSKMTATGVTMLPHLCIYELFQINKSALVAYAQSPQSYLQLICDKSHAIFI